MLKFLLILGDEIITDNVKLMERHFGLEKFVRESAEPYTKSEVTNQEYDTEVKEKVASVKRTRLSTRADEKHGNRSDI